MINITSLSNTTVEFLTECTYGDTWREITKLPDKYAWLPALMRREGEHIAKELSRLRLATSDHDGRVFVNMSRLPELAALIERLEAGR